jgi:hypothetical protein
VYDGTIAKEVRRYPAALNGSEFNNSLARLLSTLTLCGCERTPASNSVRSVWNSLLRRTDTTAQ